ncbi:hypothetical protein CCR83_05700 [Rhodobacter veldkampii DSM 11550]|uniref:Uncharacterized protein n=1 Tax=Phaeovulum veldkampii DSM 11550 TaxID=1185920 RepID=A0A2T4JM15_9RHOB|nr:hypothetical protein [Phaeovulum veldkampii]MBK5945959.1 hypothetical protein [Phaeovulum veldkampii DSM 11550]PTE18918.1 hypothetical protein C5F46_01780 [Phaeovulum veldkampii DSM 11550]TDQ64647.1 hypothetical protein EV658_101109 [Phaeovulum veldkampii DSM 11550]
MSIKYTEHGIGLHDAIEAAGHWLRQVDGVWQSSDDAAVQAIIDGYQPPLPTLSPSQFEWLLAYTGLDAVWDALESATKGRNPEMYAMLRMQRRRGSYIWDEALRLIDVFRPHLPPGSPPLTEAALRPVWMVAATK